MPKKLLFRPGGTLVFEDPGKLVFNPFPTTVPPTTTTIPTTGPSGCPNSWPEMYLTLLDTDYAGVGETWCGESFSPSDIQNGVTKGPVCPTTYSAFKGSIKQYPYPGYTYTYLQAYNNWEFAPNELKLQRGYGAANFNGNWYRANFTLATNQQILYIKGNYDRFVFNNYAGQPTRPVPYTFLQFVTANLGHIVQGAYPTYTALITDPTYSNYKLPPSFFSPYIPTATRGNGVTIGGISYFWQKGNGW